MKNAAEHSGDPGTHGKAGVRWVLGAAAVLLLLGGGTAVLTASVVPFPLRFAGWTLMGPGNQEKVRLSNVQLGLYRPGGERIEWRARYYSVGPQSVPEGALEIRNRRIYRLGPFTLIGP